MDDLDERLAKVVGFVRKWSGDELAQAVEEARALLKANMTPGWLCPSCKAFNGSTFGRVVCRCCGEGKV